MEIARYIARCRFLRVTVLSARTALSGGEVQNCVGRCLFTTRKGNLTPSIIIVPLLTSPPDSVVVAGYEKEGKFLTLSVQNEQTA